MILDNIFQIAYVTRNFEKALARFRAEADLRAEVFADVDTVVRLPTGPEVMRAKVGFLWVGDFQYELIQPLAGLEDIYGAWLPDDDSLRMHHTCVRVPDWDQFKQDVKEQPYPIAFEGGNGPNYFLYLDARETLGHYLEYAYLPQEIWVAMGGR